jgi:hypothetical protein
MSGASNLGYHHIYPNSNVNGEFVNKTGANYAGNFGSNQIPVSSHSLPSPSSNVVAASGTWTGCGGRKRKNISRIYKMKGGKSRKIYRTKKARGKTFRKKARKHSRRKRGGDYDAASFEKLYGSTSSPSTPKKRGSKEGQKALSPYMGGDYDAADFEKLYGKTSSSSTPKKRGSKEGQKALSPYMGGKRRYRHKKSKKGKRKSHKKRRTRRHRMRGGVGYTQYQSNVPYTPGYAVADSALAPKMSALANPPPYSQYNHCVDNYNHYAASK